MLTDRYHPHRLTGIAVGILVLSFHVPSTAQPIPTDSDLLKGGAFELGTILGAGIHSKVNGLQDCIWFGVRTGHRFKPFKGTPRFQTGFRTGFEGCYTDHTDGGGRVDMIYINVMFLNGWRTGSAGMAYWAVGGGEMLGDNTPGGGRVQPRPSLYTGPGFTRAVTRHLFVDISVMTVIFENFDLGPEPVHKSVLTVVPNLLVGIQL